MAIESNSYVEHFIPTVQQDLTSFLGLENEIVQERQSWLNSGAAEELAEFFYLAYGIEKNRVPPHKFQEIVAIEQNNMFGGFKLSQQTEHVFKKVFPQLPVQVQTRIKQMGEMEQEHRTNYQQAIKPVSDQSRVLADGLYNGWLEFMGRFRHVQDFAQFLSDEDFSLKREEQRPFLGMLARRLSPNGNQSGGTTGLNILISQKIIQHNPETVEEGIFADFLSSLSNGRQNRSVEVTLQWLRLLSYPSEDLDSERVLMQIRNSGILPGDLKDQFATFIKSSLSPHFLVIERVLAKYKPQSTGSILTINMEFKQRPHFRKRQTAVEGSRPTLSLDKLEMPKRPTYELVLNGQDSTSQEDLDNFIRKVAWGLAPDDLRMENDVRKMIEALAIDPFGLGVGKLTALKTTSLDNTRRLSLRRLRLEQRPTARLEHPNSKTLRAVFHMDNRDGRDIVVVHEILTHGDFDSKYTG